jgi:hypothetical protein
MRRSRPEQQPTEGVPSDPAATTTYPNCRSKKGGVHDPAGAHVTDAKDEVRRRAARE